MYWWNYRRNI